MAVSAESSRGARPGSSVAGVFARLIMLCAVVPYAVVGLGLRFLMARVFFIEGQTRIEGLVVPITLFGSDVEFSVILPAAIKDSTFRLFETQYAALPLPPTVAAYLFTYAEFVLPICLVLGFATRLSAFGIADPHGTAAGLRGAAGIVDDAHLLGRDPDGADVGWARRHLARSPDPLHLPEIGRYPHPAGIYGADVSDVARISASPAPTLPA